MMLKISPVFGFLVSVQNNWYFGNYEIGQTYCSSIIEVSRFHHFWPAAHLFMGQEVPSSLSPSSLSISILRLTSILFHQFDPQEVWFEHSDRWWPSWMINFPIIKLHFHSSWIWNASQYNSTICSNQRLTSSGRILWWFSHSDSISYCGHMMESEYSRPSIPINFWTK